MKFLVNLGIIPFISACESSIIYLFETCILIAGPSSISSLSFGKR